MYTIPSYSMDDFEAKVSNICKKFKVDYTIKVGDKKEIYSYKDNGKRYHVYGHDVEIFFDDEKKFIETGYTYLGCIKKDIAITIHPSSDFELSSLENEIKTFPCNECGKKIARNIIHVFKDENDNVTVYGSGCAVKKFGVDINRFITKFEKIRASLNQYCEDIDDILIEGFSGKYYMYAAEYCQYAMTSISKWGYISVSKSQYNDNLVSTKDDTDNIYYNLKHDLRNELVDFDFKDFMEFSKKYVDSLNDSDFKFNMKSAIEVMENDAVTDQVKGYVCYLVFEYWKSNQVDVDKETFNEDYSNVPVGSKIKKLNVELLSVYIHEGYYGMTFIYTMKGEDGIKYKWFASKELDMDKKYIITSCTVKDHEDHPTYGKAVILTRCRTKEV